jgi:hypothetical protein
VNDAQSLQQKSLMTCGEIGKAVTSTLHMNQILEIVFDRISQLILAKNWTLFLLRFGKQPARTSPLTIAHFFDIVVCFGYQQNGGRLPSAGTRQLSP